MSYLQRHRSRLFKIALWLAAVLLLLGVLRTVSLADTWAALRQLTAAQVAGLIVLNLLILALLNARWWVILRGHQQRLPFLPLLGYRLATFGVSYFTPGPHFGGEPLQVYFVEKEQGIPRATAVAAMTLDKSIELLVNFLFLTAGVALIIQQRLLSGLTGAGILVALVVLLLLPTLYLTAVGRGRTPLATFTGRTRWHDHLQSGVATLRDSETAMAHFLRHSPGSLLLAVGLALLTWGLMIGEFWLMVAYLGTPLTPIQLIVTLTAARLAILLFLPGGLGVLEASQVMAFGLMGLNPAVGVSAGLLIRARDVSLGAAGLWWGSRKLDQVRGADALSLPSPIEDVVPAPGSLPAPLQPGTRPQKSS